MVANNDDREGMGKDAGVTPFVQCSPNSHGKERWVPKRVWKWGAHLRPSVRSACGMLRRAPEAVLSLSPDVSF